MTQQIVTKANLGACFGAVHDGVTPVQRPLVSHLGEPLVLVVITAVHDPPEQGTKM